MLPSNVSVTLVVDVADAGVTIDAAASTPSMHFIRRPLLCLGARAFVTYGGHMSTRRERCGHELRRRRLRSPWTAERDHRGTQRVRSRPRRFLITFDEERRSIHGHGSEAEAELVLAFSDPEERAARLHVDDLAERRFIFAKRRYVTEQLRALDLQDATRVVVRPGCTTTRLALSPQ